MIRFFTRHPTAANLLMAAFLIAGALSAPRILRETQPHFAPSEVEIRIRYAGATAQEVEEVIGRRVEDAVDGISFVKEIRVDAREGMAAIVVEMDLKGDIQTFLRDIETGIDAIDDFPPQVENPVITELGRTDSVLSLLVSGPMYLTDLKAYAEDLKDRLKEAGISLINIEGFSDHQIRVSLYEEALQSLGLSAAQVAERIASRNRDIPLGILETRERDILLRLVDQRRTPDTLENLIILDTEKGGIIRLGDIADIQDLFEHDEDKIMSGERRIALLKIEKSKTQDAIRVAERVKAFVEDEKKRHPQMELIITQDETTILKDRLQMLIINGIQGLVLVFATMCLFFNIHISFWVAMGLPVSFLGAFFLIPYTGLSINMFTMVGMLMALGLIMDDAIVIAENIMVHRRNGKSPLAAAMDGTREVAAGVISSFISTLGILGPLAFIHGQIGNVLKVVPLMLILVVTVSLVEAFWILPAHLHHAMNRPDSDRQNVLRDRFDLFFNWMRDRLLGRSIDFLLNWRYPFLGFILGLFILSIGMLASGKIKFQGFPDMEGDVVVARLLMPQGTPLKRTQTVVDQILAALDRTNLKFKAIQPGTRDLVRNTYVQYNRNTDSFENGPHVATITVDLLTAEKRSGSIDEYLAFWRSEIGSLPDVLNLNLSKPWFGPGGQPIELRLRGKDLNQMKLAVTDLKTWFSQFQGVVNLADDLRPGKFELRMKIRKEAHGIGIDATQTANQLRAAFQGLEADEIQVGSEAYEIQVRLAGVNRNSLHDIENFKLVTAHGRQVPLKAVVEWKEEKGWARISRHNGMRAVTLRGDVDTRQLNTNELIALFDKTYRNEFHETYPDLKLTIDGSLKETNTARMSMLGSMGMGFIGIFLLLSFQFRTYTEPLIVMVAIPFSLIGVIWGHALMGIAFSMPSLLGFIALGGVVVNDSILLVIFLKQAGKKGMSLHTAAARASRERFRAVILTSSTTIAGLLPLLFEKSLQAQILIPLVVSATFGLMASTAMVLLVIPCMYLIMGDLGLIEKIDDQTLVLPVI